MRAPTSALALLALCPLLAAGQELPLLRAEFWIDLQPVAAPGEPWPVQPEEAARRLLEEASWVFGGMLWGFGFAYSPLDRGRGIGESFELEPLGRIAKGDPRLLPGPGRVDERPGFPPEALRAYVEYRPDEAQAAALESYGREPWARAQGLGSADLKRGWPGRREAYEDSLREALRAYLRGLEPNKPRMSKGRVVFDRPPTIAIREGRYLVQSRARVEVLETLPYVVY
jgi:hypothetical protein